MTSQQGPAGAVGHEQKAAKKRWDVDEEFRTAGEPLFLDAEGWQYYADFESPAIPGTLSGSAPALSPDEAVTHAESVAPDLIWNNGAKT